MDFEPGKHGRRRLLCICLWVAPWAVGCEPYIDVDAREGRSAVDWLKVPADPGSWNQRLDESLWRIVTDSSELRAEAMLHSSPTLRLTEEQAADLTATSTQYVPAKYTPYLVRAVGCKVRTAEFEIQTRRDGELWVSGGVLSHRAVPIQRRTIVVWLEHAPSQLYVTFSVAE